MILVSSAWSLFMWDCQEIVIQLEDRNCRSNDRTIINSKQVGNTATGLENWAIGSTFAAWYSSLPNSESESTGKINKN